MKICKVKDCREPKKSWGLKMMVCPLDGKTIYLAACDMTTGEPIANAIHFSKTGRVFAIVGFNKELMKRGYDPNEHGNFYVENGAIEIIQD